MKSNTKGFTLTELLVTIIIASIMVLMVGKISEISIGSHEDLRKEDLVFKDLYYGLDLLAYSMRNVNPLGVSGTFTGVNKQLRLVNNTPGSTYDRTFRKNVNNADFEYIDTGSTQAIIQGVNGLNFDFRCSQDAGGNWLDNSCTAASRIFHFTLSGTKDKEPFNISVDATRRN